MEQRQEAHVADRRERDRRRRSRFVWREQRTGFDRRCPQGRGAALVLDRTLAGLRDRPGILRAVLVAVNVLNIADLALTLNVLEEGGGEANPIMRWLFAAGPVWAALFKIAAVLLTSLLVWRCRSYRTALGAALAMLVIFAVIALYHLYGLAALA